MSDEQRQKLLDAGIELLSRKTFTEISMDQVAELSGFSKPMIYYYFENKEGYYRAVAGRLFDIAEGMLESVMQTDLPLRENLKRYVDMRLRMVEEQPGLVRAFLSILYDPNIGLLLDNARERFDAMRADILDPLFDRAVERGEIDPGTNRMLVLMMMNSTLIAHTLRMTAKLPCEIQLDPAGMVDILFDGISPAGTDGRIQ